MIRPLLPGDAEELAALHRANRDFAVPFQPALTEGFYTVEGQRRRLAEAGHGGEAWRFAILDGAAIAGTIGPTPSAADLSRCQTRVTKASRLVYGTVSRVGPTHAGRPRAR